MRAMEADEGYIFIQPDQSGAEALVVAYEAPPARMLRLFQNGIKPHTYTALQLYLSKFGTPDMRYIEPEALKAHPNWPRIKARIEDESPVEYKTGKTVRHAKNYDMKGPTFATSLLVQSEGEIVLSEGEATRLLKEDDALFPELIEWHEEVKSTAREGRILKNLFGHPRYFGGRWDNALERKLYAFIPQSTVGMITNYAFVELQDYIEETGRNWHLLNNKHDSFLLMVPEADREEAIAKARKHIERTLRSSRGVEYQMRSGVSVGRNWGKWHPKKNPEGMKELK